MKDYQVIERYIPPLKRWRVWDDIEEIDILAKVMMDGASIPVYRCRPAAGGTIFIQSMGDFLNTEAAALIVLRGRLREAIERLGDVIENSTVEQVRLLGLVADINKRIGVTK